MQAVVDFAGRRPILFFLVLTCLVSLPFVLFPALDLAFSRMFFSARGGFTGSSHPFLRAVRDAGELALKGIGTICLVSLVYPLLVGRAKYLLKPRDALFLATSLILGPGLIVNSFLKEFWGRARPREIVEFGGSLPFSRAWEIVSHCPSNCSFTSGEGASSIWMMALVVLVPAAFRLPAALGIFLFATALSLNRIVFGGHFLSDVLLSWTITLSVIALCHHYFYRGAITEEGVDRWFDRARDFLRAPFRLLFGKKG